MTPRRWKAWVLLEPDETFYRVSRDDPHASPTLAKLLATGWQAIPVEIADRTATREAENNVLELAAATAAALDWDQYGFAGEVVAQHIRKLKHAS